MRVAATIVKSAGSNDDVDPEPVLLQQPVIQLETVIANAAAAAILRENFFMITFLSSKDLLHISSSLAAVNA